MPDPFDDFDDIAETPAKKPCTHLFGIGPPKAVPAIERVVCHPSMVCVQIKGPAIVDVAGGESHVGANETFTYITERADRSALLRSIMETK